MYICIYTYILFDILCIWDINPIDDHLPLSKPQIRQEVSRPRRDLLGRWRYEDDVDAVDADDFVVEFSEVE